MAANVNKNLLKDKRGRRTDLYQSLILVGQFINGFQILKFLIPISQMKSTKNKAESGPKNTKTPKLGFKKKFKKLNETKNWGKIKKKNKDIISS